MSRNPFLDQLGAEMKRATSENVAQPAPRSFRATAVLAGTVAAAAALLVVSWGPTLTAPFGVDATDPIAVQTSPSFQSEMEVLTISFESIIAKSGFALAAQPVTSNPASSYPASSYGEAKGPYPRSHLDAMGPDFNVLYVPGYLPDGYSLYGKLRLGDELERAPRVQTQLLKYSDSCFFVMEQYARGFTPRSVEDLSGNGLRSIDVDGFRLYSSYTLGSDSDHLIYFFEINGTWFDFIGRTPTSGTGLTAAEVARVATSLQPYTRSVWGDEVAVVPTVAVFAASLSGEKANVSGTNDSGC
jgi:hypothetical protein